MARLSRMDMLDQLQEELDQRIGKIQQRIKEEQDGEWTDRDDAYVDGIEFAMAVISDMMEIVEEEVA